MINSKLISIIKERRSIWKYKNKIKRFDGYLDGTIKNHLYGWCCDTKNFNERLVVEFITDDGSVREVYADRFRQDLFDAGYGDGCYSFYIPIDAITKNKNVKSISARIKGTQEYLKNSPINIISTQLESSTESNVLDDHNECINLHNSSKNSVFNKIENFPLVVKSRIIICAGVPCSDIGGGQRSAQLARAFHARGWDVIYTYLYPAVDTTINEIIPADTPDYTIFQDVFGNHSSQFWLSFLRSSDVLWVELPHNDYIDLMKRAKMRDINIVYEIIDDWETSLGGEWYSAGNNARAVEIADISTYTAKVLEPKQWANKFLCPNAVDLEVFDPYKLYAEPNDLPKNGGPIFLYFGSLYGEWFWWEALVAAATMLPSANFVMIGHAPSHVPQMPNIFYIGGKSNEELPMYLQASDFAICPFKPGRIAESVSPIKIFEYLAMHKPTIISGTTDVIGYPATFFASTESEFAEICNNLILNNNKYSPTVFDEFVVENSWHNRIEQVLIEIEKISKSISWAPLQLPQTRNKPFVSIIILCYNNEKIITRVIDSIANKFSKNEVEIIVIDNQSSDGSQDLLKNMKGIKLFINDKNGCSSGRNIGLKHAQGDYIAFLDSDQYVCGRSWLTDPIAILENFPQIGAVGWAAGWFSSQGSAGPIAEYMPKKGKNSLYQLRNFRLDVGYLGTGGMVVRKNDVIRIGEFDEYYDPTCFEDTDWSLRIKKEGLWLAYHRSPTMIHQAHQTTEANNQSSFYDNLFKKNERYFKNKFIKYTDLWAPVWDE